MAKPSSNRKSNNHDNHDNLREARPNILASCYAVDASTTMLRGLHYSTTGVGGMSFLSRFAPPRATADLTSQGHSGIPEVVSGIPSPPRSPPLAANTVLDECLPLKASTRSGKGGAACHITEECERLFCERLRAAFLGEREVVKQDSLVMGTLQHNRKRKFPSQWIEVWDYRGDIRFRGFVYGAGDDKSLFVFFEPTVAGKDLKPGLMALLELASAKPFGCSKLVVCLSRLIESTDMKTITRDLGWVGFALTTLEAWSGQIDETSQDWLLMAMEV